MTVLLTVMVGTVVVSTVTVVCGVVVCRRKRTMSHTPAPHWSTHVTAVTSVTSNHNNNNNNVVAGGGAKHSTGDRHTLMKYSDQVNRQLIDIGHQ